MRNEGRFREFCMVGLGGHARTKLIPAIEAVGQKVIATVDPHVAGSIAGATHFESVADAAAALPPETVFFIATPPNFHLPLARIIAECGFDMFVEKPAFVTRADAVEIAELCRQKGAVLVEGLMHRYTTMQEKFVSYFKENHSRIESIRITFVIPAMPQGTFRSEGALASASIFDIGCYPVSLLLDLGMQSFDLKIADVRFAGQADKELVLLQGSADGVGVFSEIGVTAGYRNCVEFSLNDGTTVSFAPFFYGRPGERTITTTGPSGTTSEQRISAGNAYEAMLAVTRAEWAAGQEARSRKLVTQAAYLEALALDLAAIRAASGQQLA